jgi:uncharacterized protein YfaP (DUF2135 family)
MVQVSHFGEYPMSRIDLRNTILTSLGIISVCMIYGLIGCGEDDVLEVMTHVSITSPADGAHIDQRVAQFTGTVDDPEVIRAVLAVNGNEQVIPVIDGKFSQEAALMAGENQIEVSVEDGGKAEANVIADVSPADLAVVLLWEGAESTDVDLYVVSPDDEEALLLYGDTVTTQIGGQMTADSVNGRSYESFVLPEGKAIKGNYLVKVNYYSDGEARRQPVNASVVVSVNEDTPQRAMKYFGLRTIETSGRANPEAWWIVTMVFLPDGLFSVYENI